VRPLIFLLLLVSSAAACDLATAPTSRWTIRRRAGVAWLVTPCGEPFFSIGVNTVDGGAPARDLGGRIAYHWPTFYPDLASWLSSTRSRLARWGFNSAGGTSLDPAVLALPVVPDLELGRTARFHWVDPFDPATERRMRDTAQRLVAASGRSAYRIGYFSDNEVGWWNGALFAFYCEQPETNRTKQQLVAFLRRRYREDWRAFRRDFEPPRDAASFGDLLRLRTTPTLRSGGAGIRTVSAWTAEVAARYYRLVNQALRAADPDALIFGDRLPIYYDPAAVRAMAPWVDAIATNYDVDSADGWIAPYFFEGLARLSGGRPVLVSEWFFAARENRTGNRNNGHLMTVDTQAERARGAAAAAAAFARIPTIVGTHWFQLYDHPRGGRTDGEDYNFGLVDIDDRPYDELLAALAPVNARLAAIHGDAGPPAPPSGVIPSVPIDVTDRSLAEWPKNAARVSAFTASAPDVPFGDALVARDRDGLALGLVAMDYYAPELLPAGTELGRAECFRLDWGVDAGAGPRRFALYLVPPRTKGEEYVMRADLCAPAGGRCEPVPGAQATYFGADQPRIRAEVHVPWRALGVSAAPRSVRMEVAATAFHRARWMSWSGRPPTAAMRESARWRVVPLASD
jgi:hypothetical protein